MTGFLLAKRIILAFTVPYIKTKWNKVLNVRAKATKPLEINLGIGGMCGGILG